MSDEYKVGDIIRFVNLYPIPHPHYAIYIGNGEIVHYNKIDSIIAVLKEPLNEYIQRCGILSAKVVEYPVLRKKQQNGSKVQEEALSRVEEQNYDLWGNNCEHFVTSCVYGIGVSESKSTVVGAGVGGTIATAGGVPTGVAIGAAIGSVVPVAGTIVGGAIGGFIGAGIGVVIGTVGGGAIGFVANRIKQSSED